MSKQELLSLYYIFFSEKILFTWFILCFVKNKEILAGSSKSMYFVFKICIRCTLNVSVKPAMSEVVIFQLYNTAFEINKRKTLSITKKKTEDCTEKDAKSQRIKPLIKLSGAR